MARNTNDNEIFNIEEQLAKEVIVNVLNENRILVQKQMVAQISSIGTVQVHADHKPLHFHIVSKPYNLNVRIHLETCEELKLSEVLNSKQKRLLNEWFFTGVCEKLTEVWNKMNPGNEVLLVRQTANE